MDADILTKEEQKALALQGAREAAKLARERYGIDLVKVARDPHEALALVRAYAADAMLDSDSSRVERGAAANLLLNSISQKTREGSAENQKASAPRAPVLGGRGIFEDRSRAAE